MKGDISLLIECILYNFLYAYMNVWYLIVYLITLKSLILKTNVSNLVLLFQMMEDFSGLALPPLFGGHILEAELEPGGVELGPGEV